MPTLSNSGGDYVQNGKLHHIALRAILVEQSKWYQTFAAVQSSRLTDEQALVVSFGPARCVPPTFIRTLAPRLVHISDLDKATPKLSASGLDSEAPSKYYRLPSENDIAVIGMSCKVAGADDLQEFWKILCDGKSQHTEVPVHRFGFETAWRGIDPKRKWYGNFIRDHDAFDHKFFKKSPREMASTDPQQRLMLQIAYQAVEQSGYFNSPDQDKHIGCYIGVGTVDYEHNIACYSPNAFSATGNLKSFVAGKISHHFGWTGPGLTIDTACSASAVAIHQACKAILSGDCTAALAGGATVMTSPEWFQNLAGASFLSPDGPCKPFDIKANGYCRGEAVGAVFLKKLSAAMADGDQILGVIASSAVQQNENSTPITVPNVASLSGLFRKVIHQAQLESKQISAVEAHGTGTAVGDPAEYESIRQVLGGSIRSNILSLGSVKGLMGHAECASGIVALVKTLVMLNEGAIPPQASFDTINPSIKALPSDNMEIAKSLKPWEADFKAILINNYGASGSNASIVVIQTPESDLETVHNFSGHSSDVKYPFWFCGFDDRSLQTYTSRLRQYLTSKTVSTDNLSISDLAFNVYRQSNRTLGRALIFSCSSVMELETKLAAFETGSNSVSSLALQLPRPVILCFGGQRSTFVGLDRYIYENVTVLRRHLDECNSMCQFIGLDGIYPDIFHRTPVKNIVKLQTMLFALQYSCAKTWMDCGLQIAAMIGHSFGELTALCISGVLSLKDTVRMISSRARVIRDSWGMEKGAMIAIEAKYEDVKELLVKSNTACPGEERATIACFNGPTSFTLAGSTKSIDTVQQTVIDNPFFFPSMKMKKLDVTNAFHSSLVEPLMADLEQIAQDLTINEPGISLERATEFELMDKLNPSYIAEHMRYPVYFSQAVHRLAKRYPSCIWLEAGSNSTITSLASRALGSPSTSYFQPINITTDNAFHNLTDATIKLWKEGLRVLFWPHHPSQTSRYALLLLPPYQFEKSRHWLDLKKPQKTIPGPVGPEQPPEEKSKGLWTFVGYQDDRQRSARFLINTGIKKFADYVSGHTIAMAAPLCPSTLQLDISIEALISLLPDFAAAKLQPQLHGLENHAPMCLDPSRNVWLDVETSDPKSHVWDWKMTSNTAENDSATTLHVSGKIVFLSGDDVQFQSDFARYERFVGHERCLHLFNSSDSDDVIKGRHVYKTFAEIVDYGEIYRGVQKIVGKGNESVGCVVKAYTGDTWLDTPLADSFCQVAGIFVNCMTDRPDEDIYISTKIEKWIRSPNLRTGDSRPEVWHVLACHHRPSDKTYVSDVFIFDSRNGALLEIILGIGYQRVPKARLAKALSRATLAGRNSVPAKIEAPQGAATSTTTDTLEPAKVAARMSEKASGPAVSSRVRDLLADISGLEPSEIKDDTELADIGVDSLMGMELAREIETTLKCSLDVAVLADVTDFRSLMKCIESVLDLTDGVETAEEDSSEDDNSNQSQNPDFLSEQSTSRSSVAMNPEANDDSPSPAKGNLNIPMETALEAFAESKQLTDEFISEYKFGRYAEFVLPKQTELCIALVVEAFEKMGCSLRMGESGSKLERIRHVPKHKKFVDYMYIMLEKAAGLIKFDGSEMTRTAVSPPAKSAEGLLTELIQNFPDHANDHKLTHFVGSKLAECLTGVSDGIQLIFGSAEGRELVSHLYGRSPINMAWLKQMEDFIQRLVSKLPMEEGPIKILEMGAGTGGTTAVMAPLLASLNVPVEYIFTDLSSSLVAAARKRFKGYDFMKFQVHDIEKPPAPDLLHSQHIVIANNCVHATHSLAHSTGSIHGVLRPDGFLMMLEMTDQLYWVDIIFGPLEGWWVFDESRQHVVAHQSLWEQAMKSVGYGHVDWTEGHLPEANLQRIIIGWASGTRYDSLPKSLKFPPSQTSDCVLRQIAVDDYVRRFTHGFSAPVHSNSVSPLSPDDNHGCVVLLTGATGSLGSHLVAHFAALPNIKTIVCLNRRTSTEPSHRQMQAMESRGISLNADNRVQLKVFEADTAKSMLGLPRNAYENLIDNVTHVVHNAWPMSIKRPVKGFELQFQVMRNLIDLAREVSCRRTKGFKVGFQFISSIATVGYYPLWSGQKRVPEERMTVDSVLPSGYGDAKLVCESMLEETLQKHLDCFRPMAVRIGQIAGSTISGYWNCVEHFSFLIKSSQTLNALPDLHGVSTSYFPDQCDSPCASN